MENNLLEFDLKMGVLRGVRGRGRLGKGLTGGAREEREGDDRGLTGGVVAGLLCGNHGRMGARANFKRF